jgi:hypothetical protein
MVGGSSTESPKPQPEASKNWLSYKAWCTICELSVTIKTFEGFSDDFVRDLDKWETIGNSAAPQDADFPGRWNEKELRFS